MIIFMVSNKKSGLSLAGKNNSFKCSISGSIFWVEAAKAFRYTPFKFIRKFNMKKNVYVCPETSQPLKLTIDKEASGEVISGFFENHDGKLFPIFDGFPNLVFPDNLNEIQQEQLEYYEKNAKIYDSVQNLTFDIQGVNEQEVRKKMVRELNLKEDDKVLEIACGTGQDSLNIAAQLGEAGELFLQDISKEMLKQCREKLKGQKVNPEFVIGNGSFLPYPDKYFDSLFSFGGLNVFEDPKAALAEMVRVVKTGGRIVVGDESMPPWLMDTEFAKILLHTNPLFKNKVPLEIIPVEARDVAVQWLIGGVYYLISFSVGEGAPQGNFDIPIPGKRGGTLRTRYYGRLEGVSKQVKEQVLKAADESNMSIHEWLEQSLSSLFANKKN